jgi:hypothetical protein
MSDLADRAFRESFDLGGRARKTGAVANRHRPYLQAGPNPEALSVAAQVELRSSASIYRRCPPSSRLPQRRYGPVGEN